jgi:hypothetical protein
VDSILAQMPKNQYHLILGGFMFSLLTFLIKATFLLFQSKKKLLIQLWLQKKGIEILKRQNQKRKLIFKNSDRIVIAIIDRVSDIKGSISIVKPDTVLRW